MPQMNDPRFHHAVVYMVAHDEKGSMGLVINHPLPSPDFPMFLAQVGITHEKVIDARLKSVPVLAGGPVESDAWLPAALPHFSQKDTILI